MCFLLQSWGLESCYILKVTAPIFSTGRCSFGGATPWDIEALILDIKSLLGSFSVSFCHVNRSANKLADFIAKFVSS